jgi:hypothetical protein
MSIVITPAARAAVVASQIVGQINQIAASATRTLSSGVPAQGSNPAVSATEICFTYFQPWPHCCQAGSSELTN